MAFLHRLLESVLTATLSNFITREEFDRFKDENTEEHNALMSFFIEHIDRRKL
jgi:hypothetical protein